MNSNVAIVSGRVQRAYALLSLMRPLNAVITFLAVFAAGTIAGAGEEHLPVLLFAAAAGAFLSSAGNIINDVYDVEIDRVNKPLRALASGIVRKSSALWWGACCTLIGSLFTALAGIHLLPIAIASIIVMYAYSVSLKRYPLIGNVAVGILTGTAFLFGGYAVGNIEAGIIPALFACFFNIPREILKDVEDIEGDKAGRIRTFPLVYGVEVSMLLITGFFGLIIIGTFLPFWLGVYNLTYLILVFLGVDLVLVYVAVTMWRTPTTQVIGRLNRVLKYDMLMGISAILIGTTT